MNDIAIICGFYAAVTVYIILLESYFDRRKDKRRDKAGRL